MYLGERGRIRSLVVVLAIGCVGALITLPRVALGDAGGGAIRHGTSVATVTPPGRLADAPWSGNVRVNDDAGIIYQEHPSIAVDSMGNAYAVWMDARNGGQSNWDIYFSYRPAGGAWGANVRVNDDVGIVTQGWPDVAVDPYGNAYAVWEDDRGGFFYPDIYFAYRPAGGSWSSDVRVDDDPGMTQQWEPAIAVDSFGNAYAVWEDERNGIPEVYSSFRPVGGSWGPSERVSDCAGPVSQLNPSIAMDSDGDAYAVWADSRDAGVTKDIYFSFRPAGGNWGPNERVNDVTGNVVPPSPSIAVDGEGYAYVAWGDKVGGIRSTYFALRAHDGSWSPNERISDDAGIGTHKAASIAVDPYGNAYAVWGDRRNQHQDIYFAYRPTGGFWSANVRVNDDLGTGWQTYPSIAVDPQGNAYILWQDERSGDNPIYRDVYFSYRPRQVLWLGDLVWDDADRDGVQDAGEPGVPGVVASLYANGSCTGPVLWTETTDTNGNYLFTNVLSGTHCVEFTDIPSDRVIAPQGRGTDDTLDSDADPITAQIRHLDLTADDYDQDMGLYRLDEFVPEGGTLLLLGSGLAGMVGYARSRGRKR